MQITDIKIRKVFEDGPMKAVISATFDGQRTADSTDLSYPKRRYF